MIFVGGLERCPPGGLSAWRPGEVSPWRLELQYFLLFIGSYFVFINEHVFINLWMDGWIYLWVLVFPPL